MATKKKTIVSGATSSNAKIVALGILVLYPSLLRGKHEEPKLDKLVVQAKRNPVVSVNEISIVVDPEVQQDTRFWKNTNPYALAPTIRSPPPSPIVTGIFQGIVVFLSGGYLVLWGVATLINLSKDNKGKKKK
jgi:hypothetical protein